MTPATTTELASADFPRVEAAITTFLGEGHHDARVLWALVELLPVEYIRKHGGCARAGLTESIWEAKQVGDASLEDRIPPISEIPFKLTVYVHDAGNPRLYTGIEFSYTPGKGYRLDPPPVY